MYISDNLESAVLTENPDAEHTPGNLKRRYAHEKEESAPRTLPLCFRFRTSCTVLTPYQKCKRVSALTIRGHTFKLCPPASVSRVVCLRANVLAFPLMAF